MSASEALALAKAAKIEVKLHGNKLRLRASSAPSLEIVETLRLHRSEIVALLSKDDDWSATNWRALFDERAGIAEFDGGLSRAQAEANAFESCVNEWLFQNPPAPHGRDSCAFCGDAMTNRNATPCLTRDGHVWMHSDCHPDWMKRRRLEAVTALAALGLTLEDTATASPDNIGVEP